MIYAFIAPMCIKYKIYIARLLHILCYAYVIFRQFGKAAAELRAMGLLYTKEGFFDKICLLGLA